jgi:hypothetical protein
VHVLLLFTELAVKSKSSTTGLCANSIKSFIYVKTRPSHAANKHTTHAAKFVPRALAILLYCSPTAHRSRSDFLIHRISFKDCGQYYFIRVNTLDVTKIFNVRQYCFVWLTDASRQNYYCKIIQYVSNVTYRTTAYY